MNLSRKFWILFLAASFILSLPSCKKDETTPPIPTEDERIYKKDETVLNKPIRDWVLEWQKSYLSQNCEDALTLSAGTIPGQDPLMVTLNGNNNISGSANITVQQNQSILVPIAIVNFPTPTCSGWNYQIQGGQSAEAFLTATVSEISNAIQNQLVLLDGIKIKDVQKYRYRTDVFSLTPNPDLQNCSPMCHPYGELQFMTDGYFLILKPLSPGVHKLDLSARDALFNRDFISTFTITVN